MLAAEVDKLVELDDEGECWDGGFTKHAYGPGAGLKEPVWIVPSLYPLCDEHVLSRREIYVRT
jgi:hypothetical protein